MRQRNSGFPWETCYLRWARGVVNSETLEGKSDGANHEFTRTGTNEENSVFKDSVHRPVADRSLNLIQSSLSWEFVSIYVHSWFSAA
jgi:hypothetical protein